MSAMSPVSRSRCFPTRYAAGLLTLLLGGLPAVMSAQQLAVTETTLPLAKGQPLGIVFGPTGTSLFIDQLRGNAIARVNADGSTENYPLPTPDAQPAYGVTGPDGAQWFTEYNAGNIGRLNPSTGAVTEFPIPGPVGLGPWWIVTGHDGALWFTEYNAGKIGRMTTSGAVTEFTLPTPNPQLAGLTLGWDEAIWFVEENGNSIGRIATDGTVTEFPLPLPGSDPLDITTGSDGNMWFTEHNGARIGRITTDGVITEFPVPNQAAASTIAPGPDGALWFTEDYANNVVRITTSGRFTVYPVPSPKSGPIGISAGPNGTVSFTEITTGQIGTATACGLGLVASYSGGKLATNFELGVTVPAKWAIQVVSAAGAKTLLSRQLAAVVPVKSFDLTLDSGTLTGEVQVVSSLSDLSGKLICSETQDLVVPADRTP